MCVSLVHWTKHSWSSHQKVTGYHHDTIKKQLTCNETTIVHQIKIAVMKLFLVISHSTIRLVLNSK
jgi:hypothetical protein